MKLPKQTTPVQRPSTSAALSNQQGVEASDTLDDILKVVSTVGGVAAPILGGLI